MICKVPRSEDEILSKSWRWPGVSLLKIHKKMLFAQNSLLWTHAFILHLSSLDFAEKGNISNMVWDTTSKSTPLKWSFGFFLHSLTTTALGIEKLISESRNIFYQALSPAFLFSKLRISIWQWTALLVNKEKKQESIFSWFCSTFCLVWLCFCPQSGSRHHAIIWLGCPE